MMWVVVYVCGLTVDAPNAGFPVFWGSACIYEAIWVPCCAEWSKWDFWGAVSRVMYVWVGVCVGGVAVYVLWVFLAEVEGDGGECSSCNLGDGCVECGEDVCSVE